MAEGEFSSRDILRPETMVSRSALVAVLVLIGLAAFRAAFAQTVTLDVRFKLTDLDDKPLSGVVSRVVFAEEKDWQAPGAGHRVTMDAKGEARFTAEVALERRLKQVPGNVLSNVMPPKRMEFLVAAVELEYAGTRFLYATDIYRMANSDNMRESFDIWMPDRDGRFNRKASEGRDGWKIPMPGGLVMTRPGWEVWNYALNPDPGDASGRRWTLDLAFKKHAEPVRR